MTEVFTGIGVKIQGHLKILEYKSRKDYQEGHANRILLNKRNAVHKDNASVMLVNALTKRINSGALHTGSVAFMHFGNGGTTIDTSGNVIFNAPNDGGTGADLYNPVYFQMVDDSRGALPGNQMAARHISNSMFTDADIRCLVGVNEPFGQIASNMESGINLNTDPFAFDEIGLKTTDGDLITHVIFSPVLKTASSLIEVVYTLRVMVAEGTSNPIFVNPVHMTGQQVATGVGEFDIDVMSPFQSLALAGVVVTTQIGSPMVGIIQPDAIYFDGLGNSIYALPASLALSDSPYFTISFWVNRFGDGGGGGIGSAIGNLSNGLGGLARADWSFFQADPTAPSYYFSSSGYTGTAFWFDDGFYNITLAEFGDYGVRDQWTNILLSVDGTQNPPTVLLYLDETQYTFGFTTFPLVFPFSALGLSIGTVQPPIGTYDTADVAGPFYSGTNRTGIADFWFAPGVFLDLTDSANRGKFHDVGTLLPVDLGASGELPTGSSPAVYLRGNKDDFPTNIGSAGGTFSVIGPVENFFDGLHVTLPAAERTRGAIRWNDGGNGSFTIGPNSVPDSTAGSMSFWLRMSVAQAAEHTIFAVDIGHTQTWVTLDAAGHLTVVLGNNDISGNPTREIQFTQTNNPIAADGNWHHVAMSWDTQALTFQLYVDRVTASFSSVNTYGAGPFTILYFTTGPGDAFAIVTAIGGGGNFPAGSVPPYVGDMAEFWTDITVGFDFSISSNLNKFITAGLASVDLGADGSTPTGTVPSIYFTQSPSTYEAVTFLLNRADQNNAYSEGPDLVRCCDVAPAPYP